MYTNMWGKMSIILLMFFLLITGPHGWRTEDFRRIFCTGGKEIFTSSISSYRSIVYIWFAFVLYQAKFYFGKNRRLICISIISLRDPCILILTKPYKKITSSNDCFVFTGSSLTEEKMFRDFTLCQWSWKPATGKYLTYFWRYIYSGTCLIRHTKGPEKCVGLYRMSEYSGFILVKRNTLGPYIIVGKLRCRIAQIPLYIYNNGSFESRDRLYHQVCS